MPNGGHELVRKIKRHAYNAAMQARNVKRGEVVDTSPLKVELHLSNDILTDDDLDLSQWVQFYDHQFGIEKGDTALLMREGGDWTVTDIHSDKSVKKKKLEDDDG